MPITIGRRRFIVALGGAVAWPPAARAQQLDRMRRIGVLMGWESDPAVQSYLAAFRGALAKLGWTDGSNLQIELRWGGGEADRIRTFAKELVELRPDAIFGANTPVISAVFSAISMPRRAATRRAVSSRCAVMFRTDRRACFSIAGGAVSGVPLSNGGSGAYTMWS